MGDSEKTSDISHASTAIPKTSPSLPSKIYTGRFAPSPTGPLHFGSLIAATASYLCARKEKGHWLLRIEDVDTQREKPGSSKSIIQTLENYGFQWDGDVRYQSQQIEQYDIVLKSLSAYTFPCICTRKMLQSKAPVGEYGYIYPGFCRYSLQENLDQNNNQDTTSESLHKTGKTGGGVPFSIRLRSDITSCTSKLDFEELCQKKSIKQNLEKDVGDFILKRRDGLFAYQLAVVVDDELQGVTDIVRGADLFDNTPRQVYLQCLLGYHQPRYLHFPVAVNSQGKKLSKQNLSPQISNDTKRINLIKALDFLGQKPPHAQEFSSIDDLWLWAVQNWDTTIIPKILSKELIDE